MLALPLAVLLAVAAPSPKTLLTSGPVKLLELVSEKQVPLLAKGANVVVMVEGAAQVTFHPAGDMLHAGDSIFTPAPGNWWLTPQPRVRAVILALPTPPNVTANTIRNEAGVAHARILGGQGEVALVLEKGALGTDAFSQSKLTLQPGATVPLHNHPGSVELIYVVSGKSEVTIDGTSKALGPGEAIAIPAGAQHTAKVVGTEVLQLIQFYVPGGPEQRFRGPAGGAAGAGAGAGGSGAAPDAGVSAGSKPR